MAWRLTLWGPDKEEGLVAFYLRRVVLVPLVLVAVPLAAVAAVVSKAFGLKAGRTREEVCQAIADYTHGLGGPWDWDDFLSIPIADPELEEIRQRCLQIPEAFPAQGVFCSAEGEAALRELLEELRTAGKCRA